MVKSETSMQVRPSTLFIKAPRTQIIRLCGEQRIRQRQITQHAIMQQTAYALIAVGFQNRQFCQHPGILQRGMFRAYLFRDLIMPPVTGQRSSTKDCAHHNSIQASNKATKTGKTGMLAKEEQAVVWITIPDSLIDGYSVQQET